MPAAQSIRTMRRSNNIFLCTAPCNNKIPDLAIRDLSHIINYIYVFLLLQISFYVLRLAFRNVLSYESPAEYQLLRSFF